MTDPGALILVVEDEAAIRRFIVAALDSHGFRVAEATSAASALARATELVPDAVLLDLNLPDRDGLTVIGQLRAWSQVPIVILSARDHENDKVQGLDAGADDYLTKPFGVPELLARLRAALRRAGPPSGPATPWRSCGPLAINVLDHRARLDQTDLKLTPVEFKLLAVLIQHAGKLVTHRQLAQSVWGPGASTDAQYVRVYIHQLRRKIEVDPATPVRLVTETGIGYRLTDA